MNAWTNSGGEHSEVWDGEPSRAADGNRRHLAGLSDRELLESTHTLLGAQRRLTAQLVGYLVEIEERRLHLKAACSSMFDFCLQRLKMSEGEAFRRLAAARLARRFPIVLRLVETGAVHLSALALAQHHLTEENHAELLREMSGKTKRAVVELLARRFPKPDVPSTIRKLPEPALSPTRGAVSESAGAGAVAGVLEGETVAAGAAPLFDACVREEGAERSTVPFSEKPSARIEPLSERRYRIQFTASGALKDKIERAQNLLRHKYPSGDLAAVMERSVDALLFDLERKTLGKTKRPRSAASKAIQVGKTQAEKARPEGAQTEGSQVGTKHTPAARPKDPGTVSRASRREVFARDGEQCSYVDAEGRRCSARGFLQIDHVDPRGRGGSGVVKNLRILCQAHNRFAAEQIFGRKHIERAIHLRQQRQQHHPRSGSRSASDLLRHNQEAAEAGPGRQDASQDPQGVSTREQAAHQPAAEHPAADKLVSALTRLGFRQRPARRAVEQAYGQAMAGEHETTVPELLRTAILLLTEVGR